MKTIIITQDEPFFIPRIIKHIYYSRPEDVKAIVVIPSESNLISNLKRQLILLGFYTFMFQLFQYISIHFSDKIYYHRKQYNKLNNIELFSLAKHIKYYQVTNINNPSFLDGLEKHQPDVIVSISAPQVFRERLLNIPKYGCINMHGSFLPNYRGLLPSFWQLYYNEEEAGVTVHRMASKIDNGNILKQKYFPIRKGETMYSLIMRSKMIGVRLLLKTMWEMANNQLCEKINVVEKGSYYSYPTRAEIKDFRRRGLSFR